ncbi:hypothetical protein CEXT_256361 [Caerostris extrusa]|uniref:Uncharacterized protein n=1 Tax=Caerostris extrusa TaxID=172846 RepID=A0AAV4M5M0_CAEEX|nr:hypothetical protein CEXT_256361 [Caerostris extrusa]
MYRTVILQYHRPKLPTPGKSFHKSFGRNHKRCSKRSPAEFGWGFQRHRRHPLEDTWRVDGGGGDVDIVVPLRTNGRGLNGRSLLAWNSQAISADAWMLRRLRDKTVISQYLSFETGHLPHLHQNPSTNRLASTTSIVPKGHLLSLGRIPKTQASPLGRHRQHLTWSLKRLIMITSSL